MNPTYLCRVHVGLFNHRVKYTTIGCNGHLGQLDAKMCSRHNWMRNCKPVKYVIVSLFYYFLFSPKVNLILISVPARMFFNIQSCIATFDRAPKPFFDLLSSIFPFSTNNTYLLVQSPAFCPLKDLDKP